MLGSSQVSLGRPEKHTCMYSATDRSIKNAQFPHGICMATRPLLSLLSTTCHLTCWDQTPETLLWLPPKNQVPSYLPAHRATLSRHRSLARPRLSYAGLRGGLHGCLVASMVAAAHLGHSGLSFPAALTQDKLVGG